MSLTLPTPDPAAKALSDQLQKIMMNEIQQTGPMSFLRFMELALYAPALGYYRNALPKFGEMGDFVTGPEISPIFSQCLANQCAQVLNDLNGGDILELGAGRGVMAADMLLHLEANHQLPAHYYILELSAQLRVIQRETIERIVPTLLSRVVWLNELPAEPLCGVIIGNEVIDAMPVHQFVFDDTARFQELGVTMQHQAFTMCRMPFENNALSLQLKNNEILFSPGYTSEVNLYLPGWMRSLSDVLSRGLLLLIDYGFPRREYYHPDRSRGTLMCHFQHHAHDNPLILPGIQDITAHVDFTAIAEAADVSEFVVAGYGNQAGFLMDCGLTELLSLKMNQEQQFQRHHAILRLISPNEMGELFKVIALTKNYTDDLLGFQISNQLSRL